METGLSELKELFELKDRDLRTYSPADTGLYWRWCL